MVPLNFRMLMEKQCQTKCLVGVRAAVFLKVYTTLCDLGIFVGVDQPIRPSKMDNMTLETARVYLMMTRESFERLYVESPSPPELENSHSRP